MPATAVIQIVRVLSGIIGCKGFVVVKIVKQGRDRIYEVQVKLVDII